MYYLSCDLTAMEKLLVLALVTAVVCPLPASAVCEQSYYRDCKDAYDQGQRCSGVYKIRPEIGGGFAAFAYSPFVVYCNMDDDGGGWTVFQRRINGTQDFCLNWTDYVHGFGDVEGEFWLGLFNIHHLTTNSTELRVDLADFDYNTRFAKYSVFRVGDSASKFRLTVSGYSGNAGDSFGYNNNQPFSTKDQDNDARSRENCAQSRLGAWWYKSCSYANLNGHYYMGPNSPSEKGVMWYHWKGFTYSLKATEMKVRRV